MASSWEENFCEFFGSKSLDDHQKSTLEFLMSGKDVFLSSQQDSQEPGKSRALEAVQLRAVRARLERSSPNSSYSREEFVLVVSPLNAIMKEHCEFLNSLGLTAVCLGMDSRDTAGILAGKFQFVFTSLSGSILVCQATL
ncbi:hypothetical protein Bbelb_116340 [Branchiostoma belcheri]|nr:hypothetical protein Bbelb_116340 [Branchiostoma belcheri]